MIRTVLRRPLLSGAAALAAIGLMGAGYAATGADLTLAAQPGVQTLTPTAQRSVAALGAASQADVAHQRAADAVAERDRRARIAAERLAAQKAAQEAARKAEEARKAEAARRAEAERQAAAERASREARRNPQAVARLLLADFGWGAGQFSCLDSLWTKESNWKHTAQNPSSGAYGIPQALPGSKMGSVAGDWRSNPVTQIRWGLGYIQDVYGSPCSAWSHSQSHNWY